jgi:hypothetical protein
VNTNPIGATAYEEPVSAMLPVDLEVSMVVCAPRQCFRSGVVLDLSRSVPGEHEHCDSYIAVPGDHEHRDSYIAAALECGHQS